MDAAFRDQEVRPRKAQDQRMERRGGRPKCPRGVCGRMNALHLGSLRVNYLKELREGTESFFYRRIFCGEWGDLRDPFTHKAESHPAGGGRVHVGITQ